MPCDTITTQSIKLANAMPDLLKQALSNIGWKITTDGTTRIVARKSWTRLVWETKKGITLTSDNSAENEQHLIDITKSYSKVSITWAAKRAGWSVTNLNQNTLTVSRR